MTNFKLLIDTNIFIGLEDTKAVPPELAKLDRKCAEHNVRIFIHEVAKEDIARDKIVDRRTTSLSKIAKYESLGGIKLPGTATLEAAFGPITRPNDKVDVALLFALQVRAVDFLVTEDHGIHARVRDSTLAKQVLTVEEALSWLRQTFEPKQVALPLVAEQKAYEIDLQDEIFVSLREGYPGFDEWWCKKCVNEHRLCWTIKVGGELAAIVVRKDETYLEAHTKNVGPKILKVCTFKVKPKFRGEKFGELLLKQILWFAQKNGYDLVYLTTFPDQRFLIGVIEYYGFQHTRNAPNGEQYYEKLLARARLEAGEGVNLFELDRINYPRFVGHEPANVFCVPIRGRYHQKLFPEIERLIPLPLFPDGDTNILPITQTSGIPGNTIRKVYLCRAQTGAVKGGDVLLFYHSKLDGFIASQTITSVGVVETVTTSRSFDELVRLTAKRSVFSESELRELLEESDAPLKVIDFLLVGHVDPLIPLGELLADGVLINGPPQSISLLPPARFSRIRSRISLGFEL